MTDLYATTKQCFLLSALVVMTFLSVNLHAETVYLTDSWKFEIRERPCARCTIVIYGLPSGTALETTGNTSEEWVEVTTRGGTTGWVTENYLSPIPAARNEVDSAKQSAAAANSKSDLAMTQLENVTTELRRAGIEIEVVDVASDDGLATISTPRIVGNLATLGRQNRELNERSQILQTELDLRNAEIDRLKDSEKKTFFVYGAAAILLGALLAVILPRIKPRKSNSEWA